MRLRATRANMQNTLLNALILSTTIHKPYCFLQKNTPDRQCLIKSFYLYQGASSILFTLQSCEESSEGNATKKKGRKEDYRLIYDPLLTWRDNGFYDEAGHFLIFQCKLQRWIVKITIAG